VRVLSPDSDEFAHISLRIPPQPRETILKLRPYVAMIISRDPRPIVAYSVAFETEREGGARDGVMVQVRYPDAIVPGAQRNLLQGLRADAVVPDEARLIAKEVAVGSDMMAIPRQVLESVPMLLGERRRRETERRPETALRISLDAVIFLDGELVGPDKSDLKGQFAAEFGARQALYKVILAKPVAGVEHFLDDLSAAPPPSLAAIQRNPEIFHRIQALGELRRLPRQIGAARFREIVTRAQTQKALSIARR
jgi:hypothetical protein